MSVKAVKKLLLVDDEAGLTELLKSIFEPRGFVCMTAGDGREALKIAREKSPSLIIMDLVMPKMDGIDAYKALKADKQTRDIPILVYTAQDPEVVIKKGEEALDVVDFILKPFDTRSLISIVEKALSKIKP